MNPYTWIIAHTVARALLRRCPSCRYEQVVPREKQREPVTCERCGALIPADENGARR